jgi:hypothetical protein
MACHPPRAGAGSSGWVGRSCDRCEGEEDGVWLAWSSGRRSLFNRRRWSSIHAAPTQRPSIQENPPGCSPARLLRR